MKMKIVLLVLLAALPMMGSDCVNSGFSVAINLGKLNGCYPLTAGTQTTYTGNAPAIDPTTLYDNSYSLTGASVYDIKVSTSGPDLGTISNGVVTVNGTPALRYSGTWAAFNTPQSLLTSPLIQRDTTGLKVLINAVLTKQLVTLGSSGSVSASSVPAGCSICIEADVQAIGQL